jgi:Raf kinase inhibitor-like YbhB/YbcL family protein
MRSILITGLVVVLAGCGGGGGSGTSLEQGISWPGFEFTKASAVAEGQRIDGRFTCDGDDVAPRLAWKGAPEGTAGFALVLEDPDAPGGTFTHWIVYGLQPETRALSADVGRADQGENDFGDMGYGGPCPPEGEEHHYVFRLFALHLPLDLEPGADRAEFDEAIAPHILAEARLTATYARP